MKPHVLHNAENVAVVESPAYRVLNEGLLSFTSISLFLFADVDV